MKTATHKQEGQALKLVTAVPVAVALTAAISEALIASSNVAPVTLKTNASNFSVSAGKAEAST
jgi:hypothetical protein